jgi:hypothetical protein
MRKRLYRIGIGWVGLVLSASLVQAQDNAAPPKPAMATGVLSSASRGDDSTAVPDTPDVRPVSGVQNVSLGSQSGSHSFLLPSLGVTTTMQINPYQASQSSAPSLISTSYISGRLGINKISGHSELLVDYLAGGGFSNYSDEGNSVIQSLDFSETLRWGRWSQTFGEQFNYLPGSSFNFGGLGGLSNLGVGLGNAGSTPDFRQDLLPQQGIRTTGARLSSATMAQTTYALGYRSSLAFSGTYGLLDFFGNGLQDSSTLSASAGYNYLLSPLNSMSVGYSYGRVMLSNSVFGIENHSVQLGVARRITGRLSFQVGAGPDLQLYTSPIAGPSRLLAWAAHSGLNYQVGHVNMGFEYSHSLGGGSGVLPGAEADTFSGHVGRSFGHWQTSISTGYSSSQALEQTLGISNAPRLHAWFAGVQASRSFTHFGGMFASYNVAGQSNLAGICSAAACAQNNVIQTVSIGYNWGFRPIALE